LNILNNAPLILGPSSNLIVEFIDSNSIIKNNRENSNFIIKVKDNDSTNDAIFINALQSKVGIYQSSPISTLDVNGDINIRGNIVSNRNSIDIANVGVGTINIGGATTDVRIGSTTGTTTIKSDLLLQKGINISGGLITSTSSTFNLLNTGVDTINFGGESANINIGGDSGVVTFDNNVLVENKLTASESQVDYINSKDNVITSTGASFTPYANLLLTSFNGKVEFAVDAQATKKMILKDVLEFDVDGEAVLTNINTGGAYFKFLPVNVRNLSIGETTTLITIGAPDSDTYFNNNLSVSGSLIVGYDQSTPSEIDSNGPIAYLHNTNARTIYFGENATSITTGSKTSGTFYIRSPSTVVEGDLTIKGGDLITTDTSASLFNTIATSITIGKSASNIEIGSDSGSTILNNRFIVNGSITINGRGTNNKGTIAVGQLTTTLEMFPDYLTTLTMAPTASLIYIGKAEDTDNNELGGTVIMQYDLEIVNNLIIPTIDSNAGSLGGSGLLLKNDNNRIVSSDLVRTFGSSRALGVTGDIYYSGKLTGPDNTAIIETGKITKELIIAGPALTGGLISSTNTTVNVFNNNVTALNLGGAGNETINLGSNTSKIKVLGNFIPKWKILNSNYEAVAGDRLLVNAGTNNVTVTLPATPTIGDEIRFIDQVGLGTYSLIISRNGNLINAAANNLTINASGKAFCLVYTGNARGWVYDNA
jgi:hypothetical protein